MDEGVFEMTVYACRKSILIIGNADSRTIIKLGFDIIGFAFLCISNWNILGICLRRWK